MPYRLPPETRIGSVRLRIADLDGALAFYRDLLGCAVARREPDVAFLCPPDGQDILVELEARREVGPRPPGTTGLYHYAILLPTRKALARALSRLRSAGWPLQGASDHGVSEALYLADPDGNGIELYADRPREEWPRADGGLDMFTRPLDLRGLLRELDGAAEATGGLPAGTTIGHVHLHVADLNAGEAFYHELLGFDVTVRHYPGALFLSAGGYHHHIGVNTWAGPGARRSPENAAGLVDFQVVVPDPDARERLLDRLRDADLAPVETARGWRVEDPSGNGVAIAAPDSAART